MDYLKISETLRRHYLMTFSRYGATTKGVDWSDSVEKERLRLSKILGVIREEDQETGISVLDVGCGYGEALTQLRKLSSRVRYEGIDLVAPMIERAKKVNPESTFVCGDFIEATFENSFDYVICNGVLTQKLECESEAMLQYMQTIVSKMFSLCQVGISFNIMTTYSNFQAPNLFYMRPQDIIDFVGDNLSPHFLIDQSYGLYEFTIYVYRCGEFS